ncbi:MAG: hypothetical protein ACTSU5_01820, partial [Promethearchaeota archaeon]
MVKYYVDGKPDQWIEYNPEDNEFAYKLPFTPRGSYRDPATGKPVVAGQVGYFEAVCRDLELEHGAVLLEAPTFGVYSTAGENLEGSVKRLLLNRGPLTSVELARMLKTRKKTVEKELARLEGAAKIVKRGKPPLVRWYSPERIDQIATLIGDYIRNNPMSHKLQIMNSLKKSGIELGLGEYDLAFSKVREREHLDYKEVTVDFLPEKAWFVVPDNQILEFIIKSGPVSSARLESHFSGMDTEMVLSGLRHLIDGGKISNYVVKYPDGLQTVYWFDTKSRWGDIFRVVQEVGIGDRDAFTKNLSSIVEGVEGVIGVLEKRGVVKPYKHIWYFAGVPKEEVIEAVKTKLEDQHGSLEGETLEREKIIVVDLDLPLGVDRLEGASDDLPVENVYDAESSGSDDRPDVALLDSYTLRGYPIHYLSTNFGTDRKRLKEGISDQGYPRGAVYLPSRELKHEDEILDYKEKTLDKIQRSGLSEDRPVEIVVFSGDPKVLDLASDLGVLNDIPVKKFLVKNEPGWAFARDEEIPGTERVGAISSESRKVGLTTLDVLTKTRLVLSWMGNWDAGRDVRKALDYVRSEFPSYTRFLERLEPKIWSDWYGLESSLLNLAGWCEKLLHLGEHPAPRKVRGNEIVAQYFDRMGADSGTHGSGPRGVPRTKPPPNANDVLAPWPTLQNNALRRINAESATLLSLLDGSRGSLREYDELVLEFVPCWDPAVLDWLGCTLSDLSIGVPNSRRVERARAWILKLRGQVELLVGPPDIFDVLGCYPAILPELGAVLGQLPELRSRITHICSVDFGELGAGARQLVEDFSNAFFTDAFVPPLPAPGAIIVYWVDPETRRKLDVLFDLRDPGDPRDHLNFQHPVVGSVLILIQDGFQGVERFRTKFVATLGALILGDVLHAGPRAGGEFARLTGLDGWRLTGYLASIVLWLYYRTGREGGAKYTFPQFVGKIAGDFPGFISLGQELVDE